MTLDNPKTRASNTCPLCLGKKDNGCVACWPCYHSQGLKYGNQQAEAIIAVFEAVAA